jgi:hypothetical protein
MSDDAERGMDRKPARRNGKADDGGRTWPAGDDYEEATRTTPCRPNPTDPGDAADLSTPQGYPNKTIQCTAPSQAVFRLAGKANCHHR